LLADRQLVVVEYRRQPQPLLYVYQTGKALAKELDLRLVQFRAIARSQPHEPDFFRSSAEQSCSIGVTKTRASVPLVARIPLKLEMDSALPDRTKEGERMNQHSEQPSNDRAPEDGITILGQFTTRPPRPTSTPDEESVPRTRLEHSTGAINPNLFLLLGTIGYAVTNCLPLVLLVERAIHLNPIDFLFFFAFIAPVAASGAVLLTHFSLKKGFHPLALAGFLALMLVAAMINLQLFAQVVNAV
jgi:hypothetical protein